MTLKNELTIDPLGIGYARMTPAEIEASLNAKTRSRIVERWVTARTILAECAGGAKILDKLEAAAAQISEVKWAMRFLQQEGGIDAGHPATLAMVEQLQAAGILTVDEAVALGALAVEPCSRAEELGLYVRASEVREALQ